MTAARTFSCFFRINRSMRSSPNSSLTLACFFALILSAGLTGAAPHKSKSKKNAGPQLVYDQKQTGDYNIQLHLKDFQVIALLGDDVLGEYDYNYDYADFTIKPSHPTSTSTTPKPTTSSPSSSSSPASSSDSSKRPLPVSTTAISKPEEDTSFESLTSHQNHSDSVGEPTKEPDENLKVKVLLDPNTHFAPLELIIPEPPKKPEEKLKIKVILDPSSEELLNTSTPESTSAQNQTGNEIFGTNPSQTSSSSFPVNSTSIPSSSPPNFPDQSISMAPGQIKVQIVDAPSAVRVMIPPGGIVPGEDAGEHGDGEILQGEVASYRKCGMGYARDKKGRCRRVKRPYQPFGFGRLASNLASRFRLSSPAKNPVAISIPDNK